MNRIYLLLAFLIIGYIGNAQVLNLEKCLSMADTANISIRNSRIAIESNKKQYNQYMAARFPQLTFTGDYRYNAKIQGQVVPGEFFGGAPGTFGTVQFGVPFVLGNTLQLNQVLYNPQVNYGLNSLKINQSVVEIQDQITTQNVHFEVSQTYYTLQGVLKQIEFVDSNLLSIEELIKNQEAFAREGMIVQTEVDKLKINRLNLLNSKETLNSARFQLESYMKVLVGMSADSKINIEKDPTVMQTILVNSEEKNILELKLIEAQQKLAAEEKNGNAMSYLPSLSFYGIYNYNYNIKTDPNYQKGIDGAFIGLRLDWTLFDGLEKHYKNKVIKLKQETLKNQYELTSQQLDLNIANSKNQIQIQVNMLNIAKEQLLLATNVYEQTESKYRQGTISSNDLILAETDLQDAQTSLIKAYLELRKAELNYLKALGQIK